MAGTPANPASVSTWHSCVPQKCATVPFHTSPDEASPGMRMIGLPLPVTSTVKAVAASAATAHDEMHENATSARYCREKRFMVGDLLVPLL